MTKDMAIFATRFLTVVATTTSALAATPYPDASSISQTSSDGSSTGVGNAGSFGIGSGTSDSISTSTATSNGVQDSSTDNSVDNSTAINTVSVQDLQASNSETRFEIGGTSGPSPTFQSGSNIVSGGSFGGYSGILTNGWNTSPTGIAQAATNIAVNGNFGGK